jgi:hypothetical protein
VSFSITPASGFNPPTDDGFPNFIQFRNNGTNLGAADATIVDVSGGLTATRGVGEDANKVTITGEGGGSTLQFQDEGSNLGAADATTVDFTGAGVTASRAGSTVTVNVPGGGSTVETLLFSLVSDGTEMFFDNEDYSSWTVDVLQTSADAEWANDRVEIITAGIYEVTMTSDVSVSGEWPTGSTRNSFVGSAITEAINLNRSRYERAIVSMPDDNNDNLQFTDRFYVDATTLPVEFVPKVYANAYLLSGNECIPSAMVSVRRIST